MNYLFITGRRLIVYPLVMALLALWVVAVTTSAPSVAAQGDEGPHLSVVVEALNVRGGPGVSYPIIGLLTQDDEVAVIGRHSASGWWQVRLPDGLAGWVSGGAAYVRVSGDTASVPEVAAPTPSTTGRTGTVVFQTVSGGPIYAIDASGSDLRYLTTGIDPALSPDGRWVAFTRWDDTQHGAFGSLWVINLDGTGERLVIGGVRQPKSPAWSPDGAQIAISMQEGGRLQPEPKCSHSLPSDPVVDREDIRVVVEIDGGDVDVKYCYTLLPHPYWGLRMVDVATGAFEDLPRDRFSYAPAWDPTNDWHLVYDGEQGLVNLDLNQGTAWALTGDVHDHTPVFSPDGSKIAVSYRQHDHWEIHILSADGSGRVRLTETPLRVIVEQRLNGEVPRSWNNVAPAWSPDGSQIAFLSNRSGPWEIWAMSADGANQRPMFAPGVLDGLEFFPEGTFQYLNVDERMLSWQ